MTPDENEPAYDSIETDDPTTSLDSGETLSSDSDQQTPINIDDASIHAETELVELAQPFVGQWNQLISTTNWEKGGIISAWRQKLIDSGVEASEYSDEAWSRRVGGVTSPHVGRLRRVYDKFGSDYGTYEGLYWSHFLAALDWEDAPLWLEGASREKWSVAGMREQRWQAHGAVESNRPTASQIVDVDLDEDVVPADPTLPAQGGGKTREYGDEPGVAPGPAYEQPDFGEEEELMSLGGSAEGGPAGITQAGEEATDSSSPIQPFAGLPELPDDMSDALEAFKLAILRHKTGGWEGVSAETVQKYLNALGVLLAS